MLQLLRPEHLEPVLCNRKSHFSEKPTLTTARQSLCTAVKTQCSKHKISKFLKFNTVGEKKKMPARYLLE